jgi:hypothetical protein
LGVGLAAAAQKRAFDTGSPRVAGWRSNATSGPETIERILATSPRRHVVLLAGLAATPAFLTKWIDEAPTTDILDWRIMLACVVYTALPGSSSSI